MVTSNYGAVIKLRCQALIQLYYRQKRPPSDCSLSNQEYEFLKALKYFNIQSTKHNQLLRLTLTQIFSDLTAKIQAIQWAQQFIGWVRTKVFYLIQQKASDECNQGKKPAQSDTSRQAYSDIVSGNIVDTCILCNGYVSKDFQFLGSEPYSAHPVIVTPFERVQDTEIRKIATALLNRDGGYMMVPRSLTLEEETMTDLEGFSEKTYPKALEILEDQVTKGLSILKPESYKYQIRRIELKRDSSSKNYKKQPSYVMVMAIRPEPCGTKQLFFIENKTQNFNPIYQMSFLTCKTSKHPQYSFRQSRPRVLSYSYDLSLTYEALVHLYYIGTRKLPCYQKRYYVKNCRCLDEIITKKQQPKQTTQIKQMKPVTLKYELDKDPEKRFMSVIKIFINSALQVQAQELIRDACEYIILCHTPNSNMTQFKEEMRQQLLASNVKGIEYKTPFEDFQRHLVKEKQSMGSQGKQPAYGYTLAVIRKANCKAREYTSNFNYLMNKKGHWFKDLKCLDVPPRLFARLNPQNEDLLKAYTMMLEKHVLYEEGQPVVIVNYKRNHNGTIVELEAMRKDTQKLDPKQLGKAKNLFTFLLLFLEFANIEVKIAS